MNTQHLQLNLSKLGIFTKIVPLTVGVVLMTAITAPAFAQTVVVEQGIPFGGNTLHTPASFIYGSPIPTPVPVDPVTGLLPSSTNYSDPGYSYSGRGTVVNSTLINPTLINPRIRNSTLVNPVIVNDQFYQIPVLRRSRLIMPGYFGYPF